MPFPGKVKYLNIERRVSRNVSDIKLVSRSTGGLSTVTSTQEKEAPETINKFNEFESLKKSLLRLQTNVLHLGHMKLRIQPIVIHYFFHLVVSNFRKFILSFEKSLLLTVRIRLVYHVTEALKVLLLIHCSYQYRVIWCAGMSCIALPCMWFERHTDDLTMLSNLVIRAFKVFNGP